MKRPSGTAAEEATFETASWSRRIVALFVDWIASSFAAAVFVGPQALPFWSLASGEDPDPSTTGWVLLVFVAESALLTWLVGGSFGKLMTRLRVVPSDGRLLFINPLRILARQVAVVLVIPPLVFRPDGRGLHDMLAGTSTVTLDTFRALMADQHGV